ncbi:MAG: Lrp/AsnC family transcriptional regulator [Desulfovibrio sp.]|jgi:DNA-binding Lrp family transcriptional regulator|nr:Lrp/AsnC family transcriptional regulator [Desulfovibrio sp.]
MSEPVEFSPAQRAVLGIVQDDLPDSLSPFADIAASAGLEEGEVISFLNSLLADGAIRRFGASIKHQKAGFAHNVMVAWKISPDTVDRAGSLAAAHPQVSHCYYRPSSIPDWPYELYTMIHGRSRGECEKSIAELMRQTGLADYIELESLQELKKSSMRYFPRSPKP